MQALYQENGKTSFTKMATVAVTAGVVWQLAVGGLTLSVGEALHVSYEPVSAGVGLVFGAVLTALRARSHPALNREQPNNSGGPA